MDFAMPFVIQTVRDLTGEVEELKRSEKKRNEEEIKKEEAPLVLGRYILNCWIVCVVRVDEMAEL